MTLAPGGLVSSQGEVMFLQQALFGFKEPGLLCSLEQGPSGLRAGVELPSLPLSLGCGYLCPRPASRGQALCFKSSGSRVTLRFP